MEEKSLTQSLGKTEFQCQCLECASKTMQAVLFSWHPRNAQQLAHATVGDVARFGAAWKAPLVVAVVFEVFQDVPDLARKGDSVGMAVLGFLKEPLPLFKVDLLPLGFNHIAIAKRHIAAQLQGRSEERATSAALAVAPYTLKEAGSCLHSHQSCMMPLRAPSLFWHYPDKTVRRGELDVALVYGIVHDAANQACYSPCLLKFSALRKFVDNRRQVRMTFDVDNWNIPDIRHMVLDASLFALEPPLGHVTPHAKILVGYDAKGSGIDFGLGLLLNLLNLFLFVGVDTLSQEQTLPVSFHPCRAKRCLRGSSTSDFDDFAGACQAASVDLCTFVFALHLQAQGTGVLQYDWLSVSQGLAYRSCVEWGCLFRVFCVHYQYLIGCL